MSYCYSVALTHQLLFSVDFDIELFKKKTRPGWSCPPRYALKLVSKRPCCGFVSTSARHLSVHISRSKSLRQFNQIIWNWLTATANLTPTLSIFGENPLSRFKHSIWRERNPISFGASLVHNMAGSKKSPRLANKAPECKKITARQLCN